jgi:Sec-independent protein secretion pathway component TatC
VLYFILEKKLPNLLFSKGGGGRVMAANDWVSAIFWVVAAFGVAFEVLLIMIVNRLDDIKRQVKKYNSCKSCWLDWLKQEGK